MSQSMKLQKQDIWREWLFKEELQEDPSWRFSARFVQYEKARYPWSSLGSYFKGLTTFIAFKFIVIEQPTTSFDPVIFIEVGQRLIVSLGISGHGGMRESGISCRSRKQETSASSKPVSTTRNTYWSLGCWSWQKLVSRTPVQKRYLLTDAAAHIKITWISLQNLIMKILLSFPLNPSPQMKEQELQSFEQRRLCLTGLL